ncbi:tyrosine-protein kinase-like otk [Hydractinia symbiolongicarpus]|uniref:tyrosine-protein kinase-like otk n=1 Tax=Hydractinia symbiolongicarpus TaxID=13093 RepID=UPI00254D2900|nr:tyrosine-protein kinase-like otk [Hydractinia symbiolongicarpus]
MILFLGVLMGWFIFTHHHCLYIIMAGTTTLHTSLEVLKEPGPAGPPGPPREKGPCLFHPKLVRKSLSRTVNQSQSINMSCTFAGNPVPVVTWTVQGNYNERTQTDKVNITSSEISSNLSLENLTWENTGNITCTAEIVAGKDSATGNLNVQLSPVISALEEILSGNIYSDVKLSECKVIFQPPANITWEKLSSKLSNKTFVTNGMLQISNITIEDEGAYACKAHNELATASKVIYLKVILPEFLTKPSAFIEVTNLAAVLCQRCIQQNVR